MTQFVLYQFFCCTGKTYSQTCKTWFILQLPDRSSSGSDSKEKKLPGDPLNDIRRYLKLGQTQRNSRKERHEETEEKKKCREIDCYEVRRANKDSKYKTYKDKRKKRARSSDSSTSSGSDTSNEVSNLLQNCGL